ncbi:MAG: hypothetical protein QXT81_02650 [Candidatus Bathyarchaeia archaeon]
MTISLGYFLIFGIVLVPVYMAVLAAFLGQPRKPKFAALMYGAAAALTVTAIVGIWIFGILVSLIIP